jgi:hypothetical protein
MQYSTIMANSILILKLVKRNLIERGNSIRSYVQVVLNVFFGILKMRVGPSNTIHLLVVKNLKYTSLALVAVSSFLRYNPNSHFFIHTDEVTTLRTRFHFILLEKFGYITIKPTVDSEKQDWQELKLKIIESLNGTSEIFMDADLRWHGNCPQIDGITFFVKEFELSTKEPFSKILIAINKSSDFSFMKNTSFVSFAGLTIKAEAFEKIWKVYSDFQDYLTGCTPIEITDLMRLREQLLISCFINEKTYSIRYLKDSDSIKDGQFVESSYFGTTGSRF